LPQSSANYCTDRILRALKIKTLFMKKILSGIFILSILFFSCSKPKGNDDSFHISFKQDGVSKSFTGHVLAHRDTVGNYYSLTILGANTATSFDNYIGLYIDNDPGNGSINPGQYNDNSTTHSVLANYTVNSIEWEAGTSVAADGVYYGVTIPHHFTATITSADANTIRGTFSGDYYKGGDVQGTQKFYITEGEFYAKFQ